MTKYRVKVTAKAVVTGYLEVEALNAWKAEELVMEEKVALPTQWKVGDCPDLISARVVWKK